MKLTATQERALAKLTDVWQSSCALGESLNTLQSLFKKGLADVRYLRGYINFRKHT